ncbi:MAG: hypothetical protein Q9172_006435 [Xanthocarpia lactea]
MRLSLLALSVLPLLTQSTNIVLSNDDGWAELNVRVFYDLLTRANNSVVLSAPAENKSGTGSFDIPATPLIRPCQFDSCPTGSPAQGFNASNPRLNYVNSFPVTAIRYGIQTLAPKFFGGAPELAVAGFNVGATEAAKRGIPAIAFSGTSGTPIAWTTTPIPTYVPTYANLSVMVTQMLIASGKPFLPSNIWLNVNYPASSSSSCSSPQDFQFVLSRINTAFLGTPADVMTCGEKRLPRERDVVGSNGCYASISVGRADTKGDASAEDQAVVFRKLWKILSCLPQAREEMK